MTIDTRLTPEGVRRLKDRLAAAEKVCEAAIDEGHGDRICRHYPCPICNALTDWRRTKEGA